MKLTNKMHRPETFIFTDNVNKTHSYVLSSYIGENDVKIYEV